jgi:hypothetical protein
MREYCGSEKFYLATLTDLHPLLSEEETLIFGKPSLCMLVYMSVCM